MEMDAEVGKYGYNADFRNPVPTTMKCAACRFVLRDAVEVANCGHRYCKDCFIRMKNYASNFGSQIRCKVDKNVIDIDQVFSNDSISLMIQKLDVTCPYAKVGCPWIGVLENLENHETSCKFSEMRPPIPARKNVERVTSSSDTIIKELSERLTRCEIGLDEKNKDILDIRTQLKDTKALVFKREDAINELKIQNRTLQKEIVLLQEKVKNDIERKITSFNSELLMVNDDQFGIKNELKKVKDQLQERHQSVRDLNLKSFVNPSDLQELNNQINEILLWKEKVNKTLNNNNKEDEFKDLSLKFKEYLNMEENSRNDGPTDTQLLKYEVDDIVAWKNDINVWKNDINDWKNDINDWKNDINDWKNDIDFWKNIDVRHLEDKIENLKLLGEDRDKLIDKIRSVQLWKDQIDMQVYKIQKQCDVTCKELDCIHDHLSDIENSDLWKKNMTQQNTIFVWRIYNYHVHKFKGTLYSSFFYSRADGNICQLLIEWIDEEYLGLYLRLCKGSRNAPVLPLKQSYEFSVESENGDEYKMKIGSNDTKKDTSFAFLNGNPYTKGFGFQKFMKYDDIEKFISQGTLSITCTLFPIAF